VTHEGWALGRGPRRLHGLSAALAASLKFGEDGSKLLLVFDTSSRSGPPIHAGEDIAAAREKAVRVIEKLHGLRLSRAAELVEMAVEETLGTLPVLPARYSASAAASPYQVRPHHVEIRKT